MQRAKKGRKIIRRKSPDEGKAMEKATMQCGSKYERTYLIYSYFFLQLLPSIFLKSTTTHVRAAKVAHSEACARARILGRLRLRQYALYGSRVLYILRQRRRALLYTSALCVRMRWTTDGDVTYKAHEPPQQERSAALAPVEKIFPPLH